MKKIDFKALDLIELNGFLYKAEQNTQIEDKKIIVSVHGMSSNCFKDRDNVIAKIANDNGIDYFCFNNRGSELVKYIKKETNGKKEKSLGGTSFEDIYDSHFDIIGAIKMLLSIGYKNIYLQGHSLGCTKIIYTYNKLISNEIKDANIIKESIKGIILLSLVDLPGSFKEFLKEKYQDYKNLALEKRDENKQLELMPKESFIHPISVKTFLRYVVDNKEIDFVNLKEKQNLPEINNIDIPIFMRWGNINELILEDAKSYSKRIEGLIKNKNKDISYIDGADHSYNGKEEILGNKIIDFIKEV